MSEPLLLLLYAGGMWFVTDGLFSISLYRTQPLIPDQAVRIARVLVGIIMIVSGYLTNSSL